MRTCDHLTLPEVTYNTVEIPMGDKGRRAYERMLKDLVLELEGTEVTAANAAALSGKLTQMASGALYDEDGNWHLIHDAKLDALEDLVEAANGKPVLVAYWFAHDLERNQAREQRTIAGIGLDGKAQVTLTVDPEGKPITAPTVVVSIQHDAAKDLEELRREVVSKIVAPSLEAIGIDALQYSTVLVNPSGRFVKGGPGACADDDWTDEKVWAKANPSLGITVGIDKVRAVCESAKQNPAEENSFRQLRLNQWVKQSVRWMPMATWDACQRDFILTQLRGRPCYAGLDLSSTTDITAFVQVFPPQDPDEPYFVVPHLWIPEDNIHRRVLKDRVPYDQWAKDGYLNLTEGNVVHYAAIEQTIQQISEKYELREVAFDRWAQSK